MPDKNVRVRMETTGGDASRRDIERASAAADDFGKKNVKAKIGVFSKVAEGIKEASGQLKIWGDKKEDATIGVEKSRDMDPTLKGASVQLDMWGKRRDDATIGVQKDKESDLILGEFTRVLHSVTDKIYSARLGANDSEGKAKILDFELKLKKVAEGVHDAKVGVDGEKKALADIYRLDAAVDKFGHKRATAHLEVHSGSRGTSSSGSGGGGFFSDIFGGLFGGGGGRGGGSGLSKDAAAGQQAGKSFMQGLSTSITSSGVIIQTVLISTLIAVIGSTAPALIPVAIGLGVSLGGVMFAAMGKGKAATEFKKDLSSAFHGIQNQVSRDAAPLLNAVVPMLKQIGKFVKAEGPALRDMFKASIPFLRMFVGFMERTGKILIPVFTQAMKQMQPNLPVFRHALVELVQGLAMFIQALGPGIRSGSKVFLAVMIAIKYLLFATGKAFAWMAKIAVDTWDGIARTIKVVKKAWDTLTSTMRSVWKEIVSAIKTAWQGFWSWLKAAWGNLRTDWKILTNNLHAAWAAVAGFFKNAWNGFWGYLKAAWGNLKNDWHILTNNLHSAWQDVVSFFKSLWNAFWGFLRASWNDVRSGWKALTSFLHNLWQDVTNFFKSAWNTFWSFLKGAWDDLKNTWKSITSAIKSVWQDATSFLKSVWNTFWGFLKGVWVDLQHTWNNVTNAVKTAWHDVESFLVSSWNRIKSIASTVWGEIRHAVAVPVAFIVNSIWDPFAHAINAALNFLHLGKNDLPTPTIKMAEGGIVPGPPVRKDIVPAMLMPGERVLSIPQVSMLGGHSAIDAMVGPGTGGPVHFAGGGKVGGKQGDRPWMNPANNSGGGGFFGDIIHTISSIDSRLLHMAATGALTLIDKLDPIANGLIKVMMDRIPGDSPFKDMATGLIKEVLTQVASAVTTIGQSKLGSVGTGTGSEVAKYAASFATGKNHPYVFGGSSPHGWDCSGFSAWVYEKFKFFKERQGVRHGTSESQFHDPLLKPAPEQPGALVFFNTHDGQAPPSHVGVVVRKGFYAGADDPAVGTIISSDRGNMGFRIPKKGFGTSGGFSGSGGTAVYTYLLNNVFGGNKIAAAGATASIWGESGWNPESQGTGGRGLIGWTPPGTLPNSAFTGNASHDMAAQLPLIRAFISRSGDWGVISQMKRSKTILQAAELWDHGVERAGINDVHPEAIALARKIMMSNPGGAGVSSGSTPKHKKLQKKLANGGWIMEPIAGIGMRTGASYSLGENEPEQVTPLRNLPGSSSGGDCIHITVAGDSDPDGAAVRIHQKLRRLKKKRGGQKLGLD